MRIGLAQLYGVPLEFISLNVSAGSIVVDVVIVLPSRAAAVLPFNEVQAQMASLNASVLSRSLGTSVTHVASPIVTNYSYVAEQQVAVLVEVGCPPGFWCTGRQPMSRSYPLLRLSSLSASPPARRC